MWRTDQVEHFSDLPYSPEKAREEKKRREEADARYREAARAILPEQEEAPADTRSDLDLVRDVFREAHPGEQASLRRESYARRREEAVRGMAPKSTRDEETLRMGDWLDSSIAADEYVDEDEDDED